MANANRQTRFKGPTVVSLRGAGSGGHDPQTHGTFSDTAFHIEIPTAQTGDSFQVEKPDGTIIFSIDATGNIVYAGGVPGGGIFVTQVTLSAANIIAMNATPVLILPAPGANKAILVDTIQIQMKPTATQFTGGGVVTFVYHGGAVKPHNSGDSIAAAVINSATGSNNIMAPVAASIQPPTNTGIDITNATGAFATGTGTAIVTIWYSILTLG